MKRTVGYITSPELIKAVDLLPSNPRRASLVLSLVESFGLLRLPNVSTITPFRASRTDLTRYHDSAFIDELLSSSGNNAEYGLTDDCPVFKGMSEDYVPLLAGGALEAARALRENRQQVVCFWEGGRHHAQKGKASGFCYINDLCLSIQEMRRKPTSPTAKRLSKIAYIDLDLHHGDGVASAFYQNANVLTISMHMHAKGFFPSTPAGSLQDRGPDKPSPAHGKALNIAVDRGLGDDNFLRLVDSCICGALKAWSPDAIVLQCGVDSLSGDPCKQWDVSLEAYGQAVRRILDFELPILLTGGGGYKSTNAAKAWTYLTAIAAGSDLDIQAEIPESLREYELFANDPTLVIESLGMRDENGARVKEVEQAFVVHCANLEK